LTNQSSFSERGRACCCWGRSIQW